MAPSHVNQILTFVELNPGSKNVVTTTCSGHTLFTVVTTPLLVLHVVCSVVHDHGMYLD